MGTIESEENGGFFPDKIVLIRMNIHQGTI